MYPSVSSYTVSLDFFDPNCQQTLQTNDITNDACGSVQLVNEEDEPEGTYYAYVECTEQDSTSGWSLHVYQNASCHGVSYFATSDIGKSCISVKNNQYSLQVNCGLRPKKVTELGVVLIIIIIIVVIVSIIGCCFLIRFAD